MSIRQGPLRWSQTKQYFYTSVHSKPFGTDYRSLCWCVINVRSNHLTETQAIEGRDGFGGGGGVTHPHTHMEVRRKGIDIKKKKIYIWCYCHNRVLPSAQVSEQCVCVCLTMLRVCLYVFKSTLRVDQTYILFQTCPVTSAIYIFLSPSFPAPFQKWTSQWGDTAQVSIFPQETSVYTRKWLWKNPVMTANLSLWLSQY